MSGGGGRRRRSSPGGRGRCCLSRRRACPRGRRRVKRACAPLGEDDEGLALSAHPGDHVGRDTACMDGLLCLEGCRVLVVHPVLVVDVACHGGFRDVLGEAEVARDIW